MPIIVAQTPDRRFPSTAVPDHLTGLAGAAQADSVVEGGAVPLPETVDIEAEGSQVAGSLNTLLSGKCEAAQLGLWEGRDHGRHMRRGMVL